MQLMLQKQNFLKALYLAQGIADRKSTTPTLSNVLIKTEGPSSIVCCATDLRVSATVELTAEVSKEGGTNISARHLYEIVKNLPDDNVHLKRMENNWLEIQAGKTVYKLLGISSVDFPRLPNHREIKFFEIDGATLADMISKTVFAVSLDETRQHLSGIYFECIENTGRMVATDGHRLCKVDRDLGKAPQLSKGIIIPRKGVLEIRRLLEAVKGSVEIGFSPGYMFFRADDAVVSVALIDAQFPPYQQVLSQKNEKKVVINRQQFLDALRRMSILSSEKSYGIRLRVENGAVTIATDNPDLGEAQEEIEVNYKGKSVTVGFNARYMMDVIEELSSPEVVLELNGELDPGILRTENSDSYLGVIMPMRI